MCVHGDAYLTRPGDRHGSTASARNATGGRGAPQRTLYEPWPRLHAVRNNIVILGLDGAERPVVELCDVPELG